MEIRTLTYFLAVSEEGSITKAARKLHMTQPSLSRQMMDLEKELGVAVRALEIDGGVFLDAVLEQEF